MKKKQQYLKYQNSEHTVLKVTGSQVFVFLSVAGELIQFLGRSSCSASVIAAILSWVNPLVFVILIPGKPIISVLRRIPVSTPCWCRMPGSSRFRSS